MSPILGIWASAQQGANQPGDFVSIATTTVGAGGASTVTFSSIPSTYTHLQVRGFLGGAGGELNAYLNSDTTNANYYRHLLYGDGTSAAVAAANNPAMGSFTNTGAFVEDYLDYTSTNKNKVSRTLWGYDANGSGYIGLYSYVWLNTSAITTITYQRTTGNIPQYSSFALYGIK